MHVHLIIHKMSVLAKSHYAHHNIQHTRKQQKHHTDTDNKVLQQMNKSSSCTANTESFDIRRLFIVCITRAINATAHCDWFFISPAGPQFPSGWRPCVLCVPLAAVALPVSILALHLLPQVQHEQLTESHKQSRSHQVRFVPCTLFLYRFVVCFMHRFTPVISGATVTPSTRQQTHWLAAKNALAPTKDICRKSGVPHSSIGSLFWYGQFKIVNWFIFLQNTCVVKPQWLTTTVSPDRLSPAYATSAFLIAMACLVKLTFSFEDMAEW